MPAQTEVSPPLVDLPGLTTRPTAYREGQLIRYSLQGNCLKMQVARRNRRLLGTGGGVLRNFIHLRHCRRYLRDTLFFPTRNRSR